MYPRIERFEVPSRTPDENKQVEAAATHYYRPYGHYHRHHHYLGYRAARRIL
jgi:hypothetical protein